jgi:uncharacterized protein YbjT (DUF2867 family)
MTIPQQGPILVLGAGGKTGRRVLERLQVLGLPVRGVSRSTAIPFDWENQKAWPPALAGVRSAYVTYQPDLAVPGALETVKAFFRLSGPRQFIPGAAMPVRVSAPAERADLIAYLRSLVSGS